MTQTSYLIEPDELEALRTIENIVIIDLCKAKQYAQAHILLTTLTSSKLINR